MTDPVVRDEQPAAPVAAPVTAPVTAPVIAPVTAPTATPGVFGTLGTPAALGKSAQDEDYSKEYEPVVRLAEVETKTGEEDEDVLYKVRAKLFRFSKELSEWKERGTGDVRILKHKDSQKVRLLMRREKTLKICLNHYINPAVELAENVGSDRSWVWHGVDYADGERDEAMLAIRFRDSSYAKTFKDAYDSARDHMDKLRTGATTDTPKTQPEEETNDAPETKDVSEAKDDANATSA